MLAAVGLGVIAVMLSLTAAPVLALSFTGNYFILAPTHPDVEAGPIDGLVTGLVGPLGTPLLGGLPVYSGVVPPSGAFTDLGGGNTIQWWTVHAGVTVDASVGAGGVRVDPFVASTLGGAAFASNFFANGGGVGTQTTDGYRAVHWTGAFHVGAGGATLNLSADDDAWLFLNNALAMDNGGIKPVGAASPPLLLGAGDYLADLWVADRRTSQSGIVFSCVGCEDLEPIPEPATLLLFGTTLAGLGAVVRRRMRGQKTPEA